MGRRLPNEEQKIAIEHLGGRLLNAGAGSGKTFVLMEHFIYLCKEMIQSGHSLDKIKRKLAKCVFITFTNKAAGELKERIKDRILLEYKETQDEIWNEIYQTIPSVCIGTIHGFCLRLIKEGYILKVKGQNEILSEFAYTDKIHGLVKKFLDNHINDKTYQKFINLVSVDLVGFIDTFSEIFGAPENRDMWKHENELELADVNKVLEKILEINGITYLIKEYSGIILPDGKKTPKWVDVFSKTQQEKSKNLPLLERLISFSDCFEELGRYQSPREGSVDEAVKEYFNDLKDFKDFLKGVIFDLKYYKETGGAEFSNVKRIIKECYDYIDLNYFDQEGINFSDMEYYVLDELEKPESRKKIKEQFEYFVIDEFQDTSSVQFKIFNRILGNDLTKLFCVGDVKQAIYGFRGGSLDVFRSCYKQIPQNLNLKMNYRSHEKVVHFNNNLFTLLFDLGLNYEGKDQYNVEVVKQKANPEYPGNSEISYKSIDIIESDETKKISAKKLEEIEAEAICDSIKEFLTNTDENICILYRSLGASKELLKRLIANEIGFRAQVKFTFEEDLIFDLLVLLVEEFVVWSRNDSRDLAYFEKMTSLCLLKVGLVVPLENIRRNFKRALNDLKYFGLHIAFESFSRRLGLSWSESESNLQLLDQIIKNSGSDLDKMLSALNSMKEMKSSKDLSFGINSSRVVIMTAHASKGLEFGTVVLGGIHTNGSRGNVASEWIGKIPNSLQLKVKTHEGRKKIKSPWFIYEQQRSKYLDFAESNRLFYVACTRAKSNLHWIDISLNGVAQSSSKSSWINGLRIFLESEEASTVGVIKKHCTKNLIDEKVESSEDLNTPISFLHPLGIKKFEISKKMEGPFFLPELSVTKMLTVIDCPKKFYLKNICKIDADFIRSLTEEKNEINNSIITPENKSNSADRGTQIHKLIETGISKNFVVPYHAKSNRDIKSVEYALNSLKPFRDTHQFLAEHTLRFSFHGYMMTAICDLILLSKNSDNSCQIWDYKTGKSNPDKIDKYNLQLSIYAYALFERGLVSRDAQVDLVLLFVDEEKMISKKVSFEACCLTIEKILSNFEDYSAVNLDHCSRCDFYKQICFPKNT